MLCRVRHGRLSRNDSMRSESGEVPDEIRSASSPCPSSAQRVTSRLTTPTFCQRHSLLDGIQRGCRRRAIFCESGKGGRQRNAVTQQREHSLPRGFRPCISLVEFRRPVGPRLPQPPAVAQFFPRGFEVSLSAPLAAEKGVDSPLRASARVQCRLIAISENLWVVCHTRHRFARAGW